ncbi:heterokaryon incompatibility protein-domain-containing protein [Fusarium flagelliforme]|uniref:heterokaryon incompatibility protein-domain-containing protein n=1 Tax=Fusarium flagelliforme TaxID=2675880 RepID=UPI001E8D4BE2|nr:heterokaryon incompatibility protein-domain-containing protein [Fusarium flagelliforme]KAH7193983.1 heterokaryon incompatibility protein-domain-containing protein [Fusarium flagelliforme]
MDETPAALAGFSYQPVIYGPLFRFTEGNMPPKSGLFHDIAIPLVGNVARHLRQEIKERLEHDPISNTFLCKLCRRMLTEWYTTGLNYYPRDMHISWHSFCEALGKDCQLCWKIWRRIRPTPFANARDFKSEGFATRSYSTPCDGLYLVARGTNLENPGSQIDTGLNIKVIPDTTELHQLKENPLSPMIVTRLLEWIDTCHQHHTSCNLRDHRWSSLGLKNTVPTRLLDLSKPGSWSLRVTDTETGSYSKYAALSHRWRENMPKLNMETFQQYCSGQADEKLPKDYQDVITICRALSIHYLWIDSLCIFQDSPEDFRKEAATMAEVYSNALLTFNICWSSESAGCLGPRNVRTIIPENIIRLEMNHRSPPHPTLSACHGDAKPAFSVSGPSEWSIAVENAPINKRGWVFQERRLASRIVFIGNEELYWQCSETKASENSDFSSDTVDSFSKMLLDLQPNDYLTTFWPQIIEHYTLLDLTFQEDRLVALSAIAKLTALQTGNQYLAGLWKQRLLIDLLWKPANSVHGKPRVPHIARMNCAPSWSWGSCPVPVTMENLTLESWGFKPRSVDYELIPGMYPLTHLKQSKVIPEGDDIFGQVKSASLDISCLLIPIQPAEEADWDWRIESYEMSRIGFTLASVNDRRQEMPATEHKPYSRHMLTLHGYVYLSSAYDATSPCFLVPLIVDLQTGPPDGSAQTHALIIQPIRAQASRGGSGAPVQEYIRIGTFHLGGNWDNDRFQFRRLVLSTLRRQLKLAQDSTGDSDVTGAFEDALCSRLDHCLFAIDQERISFDRRGFIVSLPAPLLDGQSITRLDAGSYFEAKWSTIRLV